jgi:sarcosine oxidase subunit gamma
MASQLLDRCALIRVQSWHVPRCAPEAIEALLGTAWPMITGAVNSGRVEIIAVGPSEWLILALWKDTESLLNLLCEAFVATRFVVTNVSSGLARIRLSGGNSREILSKACSIDVHPEVLTPGTAPRTRFAGMPVVVRCVDASSFDLIVTLSFRDYLLSWLADAELEFSPGVT